MPSGWQANVVAGAPILSAWGNTLRDRSVVVFDTAAQRDTQVPAPTPGMTCYILATGELLVYAGTAWRKPWAMPWGVLQYAESLASAGPITGPGNIPGLSFNYQHVANRRLRLVSDVMLSGTVAAAEARSFITRDAVQLTYRAVYLAVAGRAYGVVATAVFNSDAASHAYVAQMGISSGAGQVSTNAAAALPVFLQLEDIGPAPGLMPTQQPAPDVPDAEPKAEVPT